jgi:GT2 family glycosyltransferase
MTFTVMITTKNRATDLRRTLQVLRELNPTPVEILVTADGCTDETVEIVKAEMLKAESQEQEGGKLKLIVNEAGKGSVASRDRMMREARGDLVLALDDDSYPEQSDCLARIAPMFEQNPKLAIAHFPQRTDEYPETLLQTDFGPARPTRSFANSGAVLRRSTYLQLPGFEPKFFHMYEEPDYALQCVAAGYEVLFTPQITIRHHYSGATRSELRNHHRHSRNEMWSVWLRCPFSQCFGLALYRTFSQFRYACKRGGGWVIREPVWWWQALKGISYCLKKREPIAWKHYRAWLKLK